MKRLMREKHYSDASGKLHIQCPYRAETGINVHVVIKEGFCYRSEQCLVIKCRYNRLQTDIRSMLSLTW